MNRLQSIAPRRFLLFAGLLLLASLALLFWAREIVRELVVLPLSYILYMGRIFLRITPQLYFWIVLVLLAFLIAYRSLSPRRKKLIQGPPELAEMAYSTYNTPGRVIHWAVKVNLIRKGSSPYFQSSFHQSLGRLVVDVLAHRYHLAYAQVEDALREGTLDVPAEVRDYVLTGMRRQETGYGNFLYRLWQDLIAALRSWFDLRPARERQEEPIDAPVAFILNFIEEELEVSHDHGSR